MAKVDFIFFDLGKVLVDFSHELACEQIAELTDVSAKVVRELVFEGDLQARYERGQISTSGFVKEFRKATNTNPDPERLVAAASSIFQLNTRIMPFISQLSLQRFPIGILSNTCEAHWQYVCRHFSTLVSLFPLKVLSYEVQSAKPESEIYQVACQQAGVSPSQVFFTDDRQENVDGALAAGMRAELFQGTIPLARSLSSLGIRI